MIKIIQFIFLSSIYLYGENTKPYWINEEKIHYRYYGKAGLFIREKGKNYTINIANSKANKNLVKSLNKNTNLSEKQKISLMKHKQTKQYKSKNGRIYIFVYIDEYN